ncbi:MAG: hypothetical protein V3S31_01555 [Dehalococcoidia bacterium]
MVFRMPRPEEYDAHAAKAAVDRAHERAQDFHNERTLTHDLVYLFGLVLKLPLSLLRRLQRARPGDGDEARLHRDR